MSEFLVEYEFGALDESDPNEDAYFDTTVPKTALMVVGNLTLSTADTTIRNRLLNNLGFTSVTTILDSSAEDTATYDLILISESVASANVGTNYSTRALPALVMEPALFDDHRASTETSFTFPTTQTGFILSTHTANGGLSVGSHTWSGAGQQSQAAAATWASGASLLQGDDSSGTNIRVAAFETSATMTSGIAPSRRVFAGWMSNLIDGTLTTAGWTAFHGWVNWLTTAPGGLTHTRAITDVLGEADSLEGSRTAEFEPVGITDSVSTSVTQTLTHPLGLTDAAATTQSPAAATDALGITDAVVSNLTLSVADSLGLADSTASTLARSITDALGLTDVASTSLEVARTNSLGLLDTATADLVLAALERTAVDPLGLVDAAQNELQRPHTDSAGLSDSVAVVVSFTSTLTSGVGVTDSAVGASASTASQTDLLNLSDLWAREFSTLVGRSDQVVAVF